MKKVHGFFIILIVFILAAPTMYALGSSFTHPEIGEYLTVKFRDSMPYFSIYDFLYYEIIGPDTPYRGISAKYYDMPDKKMIDIDEVLALFFSGLFGNGGNETDTLVYSGINGMYSYELESLPQEHWVRAIKLINGFEGLEGYQQLLSIAGFENADLEYLESEHFNYTVKIGKSIFPYRVLAFHFEGEDWMEYTERYSFLRISDTWKLMRISKEYTDDYQSRGDYVHGVNGSRSEFIKETNQELMRSMKWGMKIDEVETIENLKADGQSIVLQNVYLFRMSANLEYSFSDKKLTKMEYRFDSHQAFYSAFISLYMRYSDPVTVGSDGDMTWSLNDMKISLLYDEAAPTVVLESY